MRGRIGAVAVATAALLLAAGVAGSAARADTPTLAPTDDVADQGVTQPTVADREVSFIRGEREASDLMGFEGSLYVGKWFRPAKEDVRKCIVDRESNFNYRANNGAYFGAYQMSAALGDGAVWMMQEDIAREFGKKSPEFKIAESLHSSTPDKWNRYWQDRAFWTIWSAPEGKGPAHWGGARC